jgi:hypothetical protein
MGSITNPTYFRSARNLGGTDIAKGYLLTKNTTAQNAVEKANSATDLPAGVCVEAMVASGVARSAQIAGRADVVCGAAVAIGDKITSDSSGRGIAATLDSQSIWGVANTSTSSAGETFEMDLDYGSVPATPSGVQVATVSIGHADLTAAATAQSIALVSLPADAVVLGYEWVLTEAFAGSAQTFNADIGYTSAETNIAADLDIDGSATDTGAAIMRQYAAAHDIEVRVQSSGNVVNATAGALVVNLFYATV